ncbi:hypothetical protein HMPREF9094_2365 [Fusobacterium animalis ATCC 51191]|uniref:Uncharacterized protein n=1 Tax=Fusobacterium animalis ATCC 51191 TaxID=997347 RepID=F9ER10_9FUSO|nr:hypothetical protein HMPREF9094_2365 [Fusobacterium animalis ATCC 51191]
MLFYFIFILLIFLINILNNFFTLIKLSKKGKMLFLKKWYRIKKATPKCS